MFVQHIGIEISSVFKAREIEIKRLNKKHSRLICRGLVSKAGEVMSTISHLQALNEQGRGPAKPSFVRVSKDRASYATTLWV